jgi:hypothetical protein
MLSNVIMQTWTTFSQTPLQYILTFTIVKKMQIDGEHSSKLLLHDQSQTSLQYILALDVWKSAIAGSIFFYAF